MINGRLNVGDYFSFLVESAVIQFGIWFFEVHND
jgi:hypothetical protein